MKTILLTFLIGCMGFISAHATAAIGLDGNTRVIQEGNYVGITPNTPPDPMIIAAYYFYYDSDRSALILHTPAWPYPFYAVLENFTTGESCFYSYDEDWFGYAIPFIGGPGIWRLSLCSAIPHDPRILTEWYFTIDNGKITYVKPQPRWPF